jgi:hypothetical protein
VHVLGRCPLVIVGAGIDTLRVRTFPLAVVDDPDDQTLDVRFFGHTLSHAEVNGITAVHVRQQ